MVGKRWIILGAILLFLTGCTTGEMKSEAMPEDFIVIAHRGASAYAPQNTLAAFKSAKELEAGYVELDIHLTKDNEIIVMHDNDVAGTTDDDGGIGEFTLTELKQLSADFRYSDDEELDETLEVYTIPTLEEVFQQFGKDMQFIIELKKLKKNRGIEEKLVKMLTEFNMLEENEEGHAKVMIQSFNEKSLKRIHEMNPDIPLIQLISYNEDEKVELSTKELDELTTYAAGIGASYEALTTEFIEEIHNNGLRIYGYTVNEAEVALKLMAIGADGIYSDRPDILDK